MNGQSLVLDPHPILHQKAKKVKVFDEKLKKLAQKMVETIRAENGIGLAAPQIGVDLQLIVIEVNPKPEEKLSPIPLIILANPKITSKGKETDDFTEGCLSLPGKEAKLKRKIQVNVLAQDLEGKRVKIRAKGLLAEILQHEIDHLNGILISDRGKLKKVQKEKIIFFGSVGKSEFARTILEGLKKEGYEISQIIEKEIKIDKPTEVAVLADFGFILPKETLTLFPKGIINVHGSLLPKYRGASPIQAAILNGEKETGVTLIKMDKGVDTGQILTQKKMEILPTDTYESLKKRMASVATELLIRTLPLYLRGRIKLQPQDNSKATKTYRLKKEDGEIDWKKGAEFIERQIRAFYPWPGSYFFGGSKRIIIKKAHLENGKLKIDELQVEGKNPIDWQSFKRGYEKMLTAFPSYIII